MVKILSQAVILFDRYPYINYLDIISVCRSVVVVQFTNSWRLTVGNLCRTGLCQGWHGHLLLKLTVLGFTVRAV